jgi:sugar-specific transcriptional regulator TrmB
MEKLKFTLFSIIVLFVLGFIGYWAFVNIQSGSEHAISQKLEQFQNENEDLKEEVFELKKELATVKSEFEMPAVATIVDPSKQIVDDVKSTETTIYKYQVLIDELEKLVKDNVLMKLKSIGSRVGTVQKFLNIYNNTKNKIDNDYGLGMVKLVTAFQKDQGLKMNGEAGVSTFNKMIDILKKKGV